VFSMMLSASTKFHGTTLLIGVMFLWTVLYSTLGLCQSDTDFYKNNYAARPEINGKPIDGSETPTSLNPQPSPVQQTNQAEIDPKQGVFVSVGADRITKNRKILATVYVNSLDLNHFNEVVAEVFRLHDERIAFVRSVFHIGSYKSITPELNTEFRKRNIELEQRTPPTAPPVEMNVTHSPAWLLVTKEGMHIVEGEMSLRDYIDEFGEVKVPSPNHQQNLAPTPLTEER
jgi:hypothetical protein